MAALSDNRHGTKPRVTWAGGEPAVGTRTHKLGIQHATSHLTIPHLKLGIQHTTNHLTIPHLKLDIQHATSHFTIPHIKLGMPWEGSSPAVAEVFHAQAHPGSFHTHARALPGSSFSPTPHLSPIHSLSAISYHIQYQKKKARINKNKNKKNRTPCQQQNPPLESLSFAIIFSAGSQHTNMTLEICLLHQPWRVAAQHTNMTLEVCL